MLNDERYRNYANPFIRKASEGEEGYDEQYELDLAMLAVTSRQLRRGKHKQFCRKTHSHLDLPVSAEGKRLPCPRCSPAPYRQPEIKAAPGPRDWGGQAEQ